MTALPAPPVPPDVDLTDFGFMPLDCARFRDSGLAAEEDPAAGFFAVVLWTVAWHQIPAASLPGSDVALAKLAGFGRDLAGWSAVRAGALRGFERCSDGRLYHRVIAEKALEAWIGRLNDRIRGGMGNAKRWKTAFDPSDLQRMLREAQAALRALHTRPRSRPTPAGDGVPPPPASPPASGGALFFPPPPGSAPGSAPAKRARSGPRPPVGEERYSAAFEQFWAAYPSNRRSKKLEAYQRWQRDGLEEFAETIVRDVTERARGHWGWLKDGGQYVPGAQVYLHGRRWNDAIEPPPSHGEGRRGRAEAHNEDAADRWADARTHETEA